MMFAFCAFHETICQIYAFAARKVPAGITGDFGVLFPLIVAIVIICLMRWFVSLSAQRSFWAGARRSHGFDGCSFIL